MSEQRLQPRITDADLVMISWKNEGTKFWQLGNVENLSGNGAGMIVDHALPVRTPIQMTYGDGEVAGIVRHCTPVPEGHFVGVEFTEHSRYSTLHFQPELLISPF